MLTTHSRIRIFYDGACPLCKREVKRYQSLLANKSQIKTQNESIDWVDISNNKAALKSECINYEDAMRLIHIKDGSGVHQVGLEVVLTLWDNIPYYRVVSGFIRKLPFSHPILEKIYEFLAKQRMKIRKL